MTIFGEPSGTLTGKEQVRAYWAKGLQGWPNLRFELLDVFSGANNVVLYYRSEQEPLAAELLLFGEDGRVRVGNAHENG